jgi:membrane-associated phospholipid phosphatase
MRSRAAVATLLLSLLPQKASAQAVRELRHDTTVDGAIAASGAVLWLGSELLRPQLAPSECRWCASNGLDDAVRSAARWDNTHAAGTISDVLAFGVVPAFAIGLTGLASYNDKGDLPRWATDMLLVAEASVLAMDVNQGLKLAAGRERPFVHALAPAEKQSTDDPADNNLSFYSGHTTWVFALAASSGTVASLRGYRLAPLVWAVGMPAAAATGWLRIAADRHYFTDVVVGAVVGSAMGIAIPLLVHDREPAAVAIGTGSSPLSIGFLGRF